MATQIKVSILGGPSKFDLMLSCFEGKEVEFKLDEDKVYTASIVRTKWVDVEAEDGSGESWNIKFRTERGCIYKGYYSSKRRTGILTYEI